MESIFISGQGFGIYYAHLCIHTPAFFPVLWRPMNLAIVTK